MTTAHCWYNRIKQRSSITIILVFQKFENYVYNDWTHVLCVCIRSRLTVGNK